MVYFVHLLIDTFFKYDTYSSKIIHFTAIYFVIIHPCFALDSDN